MPMNERGELNSLGINPGQFRHRITLLEPTITTDASGSTTVFAASDPPTRAWAKIEQLRADEVLKAGQDVTQSHLKVTMRYNQAFSANKRIQAPNGHQYIIQAVENVLEMNAYLVLMCLGVGANN